jgi:hypothetical protein
MAFKWRQNGVKMALKWRLESLQFLPQTVYISDVSRYRLAGSVEVEIRNLKWR